MNNTNEPKDKTLEEVVKTKEIDKLPTEIRQLTQPKELYLNAPKENDLEFYSETPKKNKENDSEFYQ